MLEQLEPRLLLSGAMISGTVWSDFDHDGLRDAGEAGIAAARVYLDADDDAVLDWADADGDDAWDDGEGERWLLTAADDPATGDIDETGLYAFTDLAAGSYVVRHAPLAGFVRAYPAVLAATPFDETFPSTTFSTSRWASHTTATIESNAVMDEPSPPYSLRLNGSAAGGDKVESATIDLSQRDFAALSCQVNPRGAGNYPDVGCDLVLEYRSASGQWVEFSRELGGQGVTGTFREERVTLPQAALHSSFAFRMRVTSYATGDWFIDDITLEASTGGAQRLSVAEGQQAGDISFGDWPVPQITIADAQLVEGDSSFLYMKFVLTPLAPMIDNARVDFTIRPGTAEPGVDYGATGGSVYLSAGSSGTGNATIMIAGDRWIEGDETFFVDFSLGYGTATMADPTALGTIINDDVENYTSYLNGDILSDLDGDGYFDTGEPGLAGITVYQDGDNNARLDWDDADGDNAWDAGEGEQWTLSTADDPATAGIDETGLYSLNGLASGTYVVRVVVPAASWQTSPAFPTTLLEDSFSTTSFIAANWAVVDGASIDTVATGEITSPYSARLSGGDMLQSAAFSLLGTDAAYLSYYWEQKGGGNDPEAGDDLVLEYLNAAGQWVELKRHLGSAGANSAFEGEEILLPADALHGAFAFRFRSIGLTGDDWFVDNVSLKRLRHEYTATLGVDDHVYNAFAIRPLPQVSVADVSITEHHGNSITYFSFGVSPDSKIVNATTVAWTIRPGTATEGVDYTATPASGTVSWAAGATDVRTVTVGVKGDDWIEDDETFYIELSLISGSAVLGDATGVCTIVNDDVENYSGSISGTVWTDVDYDGVRDTADGGLAGMTVYLDANDNAALDWADADGDGAWDAEEGEHWTLSAADDSATTGVDETGRYSLGGLASGTHVVRQLLPPRYLQTSPAGGASRVVSMPIGMQVTGMDFGGGLAPPLAISSQSVAEGGWINAYATYFAVGFNNPIDPASVSVDDILIQGMPASSVSVSSSGKTVYFYLPADLADGPATIHIPAGAVSDIVGQTSAELTVNALVDRTPPTVVACSLQPDTLIEGTSFTVTVTFSEAVDASDMHYWVAVYAPSQQQLLYYDAARLSYDPQTLTLTAPLKSLPEGPLQFRVLSAKSVGVSDLAGNTLGDDGDYETSDSLLIPFVVDASQSWPLGSFRDMHPLGSMAQASRKATGYLHSAQDVDTFEVEGVDGQMLSILVTPNSPDARLSLTAFGETRTAQGLGEPIVWDIPAGWSGPLTLEVTGDAVTSFTVESFTNAIGESVTTNPFLPQPIDSAYVPLGQGGRWTVVGGNDSSGAGESDTDRYTLDLTDYVGKQIEIRFAPTVGGSENSLKLTPPGGSTILSWGLADYERVVTGYVVSQPGIYTLEVEAGMPQARYVLSVTESVITDVLLNEFQGPVRYIGRVGQAVGHAAVPTSPVLWGIVGNRVAQIDPASGQDIRSITIEDGNWTELAYDGQWLYAIKDGLNTVYRIDPASGATDGTIVLEGVASEITAMDVSDAHIAIAISSDDMLHFFDKQTGESDPAVSIEYPGFGASDIHFMPERNAIAVFEGQLWEIDIAPGGMRKVTQWSEWQYTATDIAWLGNALRYVTGGRTLYALDIDSGSPATSRTLSDSYRHIAGRGVAQPVAPVAQPGIAGGGSYFLGLPAGEAFHAELAVLAGDLRATLALVDPMSTVVAVATADENGAVQLDFVPEHRGLYMIQVLPQSGAGTYLLTAPGQEFSGLISAQVFANNSFWDGYDRHANAGDDAAVLSPSKEVFWAGGAPTAANTTGAMQGITGIVLEVAAAGASYWFDVFVPGVGWQQAPSPYATSERDAGEWDGSKRISITWPEGAISGTFLRAFVWPQGGNSDDAKVFYFGNLPGDANGDFAVTAADYGIWADEFGAEPSKELRADFNGDGQVTHADYGVWADNFGRTLAWPRAGDFNYDGAVTHGDYTVWADGFGWQGPRGLHPADGNQDGKVSHADYTIWADHFGEGVVDALTIAQAAEPAVAEASAPAALTSARARHAEARAARREARAERREAKIRKRAARRQALPLGEDESADILAGLSPQVRL